MESGDGWIVRVRPGARALPADDVRALATSAKAYGNGQLELTRRANLQVRGVTIESLPRLQTELVRLGLAEATPEQERSASLLVNPLSDLDPACATLGPLAAEIERLLGSAETPGRLPAKFCLLLDGGGSALEGVSADIRVDLRRTDENIAYLSAGDRGARFLPIGSCRKADAPSAIQALMSLSSFQDEGGRRMRDVIAADGVEVAREAVAPWLLNHRAAPPSLSRTPVIGFQTGNRNWFGLGLPFGSGDVENWKAIADVAERFGDGHVRLTPRRSVVIAGVRTDEQREILATARDHGLLVDDSDPLSRITACVGAPACQGALGETRALARDLAEVLRPLLAARATVHVSGCSKSCAQNGPASVTVIRDREGCKLGLDRDVAATSASSAMSLALARRQLATLAQDFRDAAGSPDVSPFLRTHDAPA
jgi:precorrin-3B synthase